MKKMNNKGFSLVELIVVVLIMAIIAVALAPQVMKWVENSRKSTDIENYNALIEAANVAATNEKVIEELKTGTQTISMTSTNTTVTSSGSGVAKTEFEKALTSTLPNWNNTAITAGIWKGSTFTIVVKNNSGNGVIVEKGSAGHFPEKDFE